MTKWLSQHWVPGALFMAAALLAIVPLMLDPLRLPVALIYLHSPGYMLHQVEEHTKDRFRIFINQRLFGGIEALTTVGVLWINLPGVWGVNLAAVYSAYFLGPGYGLAAPYLMLVNAIAHLGTTARTHGYNPGLWTSLAIFIPLGMVTLYVTPASPAQHALGLGVAVAIHLLIIIGVASRVEHLRRTGSSP